MRTVDDYEAQLQQLLPPGPAWDPDVYPLPAMVIRALAEEMARVDARGEDLLAEMFPGSISEFLPDWERIMGLPDSCTGPAPSFGERVQAVVQRFASVGRQDAAYFRDLAIKYGYPNATVEEWRTPRVGSARCGANRMGSWDVQFVWTLHLGSRLPGGTRVGVARVGQRLGTNPHDIVECVIRRYGPAHGLVFFDYG